MQNRVMDKRYCRWFLICHVIDLAEMYKDSYAETRNTWVIVEDMYKALDALAEIELTIEQTVEKRHNLMTAADYELCPTYESSRCLHRIRSNDD